MIVEIQELRKSLGNSPRNSGLLLQLGWLYLKDGNYKQAKDEYHLAALFDPRICSKILMDYERVLLNKSDDLQARLSIISLLLSWQQIDAAALELEELLDIFPDNNVAFNILGKIYIKQERFDDALALLTRAISVGIKDTKISEMLAAVYLEKGLYREAISFFEELPKTKHILRTLAELYARIGNFDLSAEKYHEMFLADPEVSGEAIKKLEELLLKNEKSLRLREILTEIYSRCMQPEKAVMKLKEILSAYPEKINWIIDQLKKILKNYPGHPDASLLLAGALSATGNYSESIEEYSQLTKGRPELLEQAVAGCLEILKKYPEQFLARQFLVESYIDMGNYKGATEQLKSMLDYYKEGADYALGKSRELLKKYSGARVVLGYVYLIKGDPARAAQEAETAINLEKTSIPALLLLSEVYKNQGLCRKSVETLSRALELEPENLETQNKYAEARRKELLLEAESIKKRMAEDEWKFSLHLDLAKIYIAINLREDAVRELQLAMRDTKRAPFAVLLLSNLQREEGRFDLATSILRKTLENITPDLADIAKKLKFSLALACESQGLIKKGLNILEDILQEDYDFPNLSEKINFLKASSLASIQNKMLVAAPAFFDSDLIVGQWGREGRSQAKKQTLSVSFGQNYNVSGFDYFIRGMYQAAAEEFTLCAQLDPNFAAGANNLGVTLLIGKRYAEALHRFLDAFEIDPSSSIISNNIGLTYYLMGNLAEAQKWLEKAVAVNRGLSAGYLNLGDVLIKQNQVQKAIENYKKITNCDTLTENALRRLWGRVTP